MSAKSSRDIGFVIQAVAWASVAMLALKLLVAPLLAAPEEVKPSIVTLQSTEVAAELKKLRGKPVALFIYASWCSFCRQQMPLMAELISEKALEGKTLLFLSLDRNPDALSRYLAADGYGDLFTPYLVSQSRETRLETLLPQAGIDYPGTIPYTAFLDADGKLVAQFSGMAHKDALVEAAGKAR